MVACVCERPMAERWRAARPPRPEAQRSAHAFVLRRGAASERFDVEVLDSQEGRAVALLAVVRVSGWLAVRSGVSRPRAKEPLTVVG